MSRAYAEPRRVTEGSDIVSFENERDMMIDRFLSREEDETGERMERQTKSFCRYMLSLIEATDVPMDTLEENIRDDIISFPLFLDTMEGPIDMQYVLELDIIPTILALLDTRDDELIQGVLGIIEHFITSDSLQFTDEFCKATFVYAEERTDFRNWLISYAQREFPVEEMPRRARSLMIIIAQLAPTYPQDVCHYGSLFTTCLASEMLRREALNAILFIIQSCAMNPSEAEIEQVVGLMNLLPFDPEDPELCKICFRAMRAIARRNVFAFDIDKVFSLINSPVAKDALLTLCEATKISEEARVLASRRTEELFALFSTPMYYPVYKYAAQVVYNVALSGGEVANALADAVPLMMNPGLQEVCDYETKSLLLQAAAVVIDKVDSVQRIANFEEIMDYLAEQLVIDDMNTRADILTAIASTKYDSPMIREYLTILAEEDDDIGSSQMASNILQMLEQAEGW